MSIVHMDTEFAILDEEKYYDSVFKELNLKTRSELYEISSKFMPDSQFEAIKRRGISNRKRKIKETSENSNRMEQMALKIKNVGTELKIFKKKSILDNNLKSRKAAETLVDEKCCKLNIIHLYISER